MNTKDFDLAQGEYVVCVSDDVYLRIGIHDLDDEGHEVWFSIEGAEDLVVQLETGAIREISGTPKCCGLPRIWLLFSLLLSHRIRREVFYPVFNEFLEDYSFAKRTYRRKWNKRWLALVFSVRTISMTVRCLGIQFGGLFSWLSKRFLKQLARGDAEISDPHRTTD